MLIRIAKNLGAPADVSVEPTTAYDRHDRSADSSKRHWSAILGILFALTTLFSPDPSIADTEEESRENLPSILLVVFDTVRVDAVSAYGKIKGTTPNFDRLAETGIRYSKAFSSAPWTLPSHATLFTGLGVDVHQVGMPGHPVLSDEFETLAELLSAKGYETVAFSENALVSDLFELLRGFEIRVTSSLSPNDYDEHITQTMVNAMTAFQKWARTRDSDRPFFAFVNLLDAHRPFEIRAENRWVPSIATPREIADRHLAPERQLCGGLPTTHQIAIQRGLYLGDVHAADEKLASILAAAKRASQDGNLISIVTSDHGELFGEQQLMGHEFSLHTALLHVPLVIHGVPGATTQVVDTPVSLEDLMPSILGWVGAEVPQGLSGTPLPLLTKSEKSEPRSIFAAYTDRYSPVPPSLVGQVQPKNKDRLRQLCTTSNRVRGGMAALIRYPFKYVWFENYPASLYDLSWDASEISDQARYKKDLLKSLEAQIRPLISASGIETTPGASSADLSDEALEALRQLGYIE